MTTRCKKGEIERIGYTKKTGTKIKAECIKDRGLPGKTPESQKIPFKNLAFERDDLGKYGYSDIVHKSASKRHQSLDDAIRYYGSVPVLRKVNVLEILNRNTNPKLATKLETDKKWIEKTYHTNKRKK